MRVVARTRSVKVSAARALGFRGISWAASVRNIFAHYARRRPTGMTARERIESSVAARVRRLSDLVWGVGSTRMPGRRALVGRPRLGRARFRATPDEMRSLLRKGCAARCTRVSARADVREAPRCCRRARAPCRAGSARTNGSLRTGSKWPWPARELLLRCNRRALLRPVAAASCRR